MQSFKDQLKEEEQRTIQFCEQYKSDRSRLVNAEKKTSSVVAAKPTRSVNKRTRSQSESTQEPRKNTKKRASAAADSDVKVGETTKKASSRKRTAASDAKTSEAERQKEAVKESSVVYGTVEEDPALIHTIGSSDAPAEFDGSLCLFFFSLELGCDLFFVLISVASDEWGKEFDSVEPIAARDWFTIEDHRTVRYIHDLLNCRQKK